MNEAARKEFLLNALRAASLRAKMMAAEFDTVGILLKADGLTPDQAIEEIRKFGGIEWLCTIPDGIMK